MITVKMYMQFFKPIVAFLIAVLTISGLLQGQVLVVDDFTELGSGDSFPLTATSPLLETSEGTGLSGALGTYRQTNVTPIRLTLPTAPPILPITAGAALDTSAGTMTLTAEAEQGVQVIFVWFDADVANDQVVPVNLALTDSTLVEIRYTASSDVNGIISLGNTFIDNGTPVDTGSNREQIVLPGGQGVFTMPISSIDDPVSTLPSLDPTSVDNMLLALETTATGESLVIDRVAFIIPEPGTIVLLAALLGPIVAHRRRGQVIH